MPAEARGAHRPSVRELTERERDVLVAMIERGVDDQGRTTRADRNRWLDRVGDVRAGDRCRCGTCPSIDLTDEHGRTPSVGNSRVVLQARGDGGLLLLFIDGDRPSYLELAPDVGHSAPLFPPTESIEADRQRRTRWAPTDLTVGQPSLRSRLLPFNRSGRSYPKRAKRSGCGG